MPKRRVELETCFNFRDLGGYETVDGDRLRWGVVYRSSAINWLTQRDRDQLLDIGLRTILDLRTSVELEREGPSPLAAELAFHHVPLIEEDSLPFEPVRSAHDPAPPPGSTYLAIAFACGPAIASAVRAIADAEHAVVFHCTAGRDRTGIIAALLLSLLGVPDDTVVADYMISDEALAPTRAWAEANNPRIAAEINRLPNWLLSPPSEVPHAFLTGLRRTYGSVENYLFDIGVDDATMATLRRRLIDHHEPRSD